MAPISRFAAIALFFSGVLISAAPTPVHSRSEVFKRSRSSLISRCNVPGTLALTFDDGPAQYTEELLDILKEGNAKATFFMNGQNYDSIFKYKATVLRAKNDGHQIGSHTWSHEDLTSLNREGIKSQMRKLDDALKAIIKQRPVYMRPPYGKTNKLVEETLAGEGYEVVLWDVDSGDSQGQTARQSYMKYEQALKPAGEISKPGHIFLQHDVYKTTVDTNIGFMKNAIKLANDKGFKLVTVGECLGKPENTWYRD
ncbi:hypothetical protein BGX27_005682 [Mortierella sp. AM989]|nr:hypothetical protein BGX27_005682 [Mortierella sp. AM989]